ncbi:hypothetical protein VFPPC_01922 [Pochonia chlamydosporia 170]|uniref:Uncharacterized protein n=1 Tax=Pochonia chlamydosporia 170 TaxID=1380566 RepID=A0A179F6C8_METCM|nr:hypothetical protein VFPPC_01922 [Pochonia chlamydosporia 170]OAQ60881.1 hypothetical protein VFPPC_01922 [Pochonia chlamydosporia 170]
MPVASLERNDGVASCASRRLVALYCHLCSPSCHGLRKPELQQFAIIHDSYMRQVEHDVFWTNRPPAWFADLPNSYDNRPVPHLPQALTP